MTYDEIDAYLAAGGTQLRVMPIFEDAERDEQEF